MQLRTCDKITILCSAVAKTNTESGLKFAANAPEMKIVALMYQFELDLMLPFFIHRRR